MTEIPFKDQCRRCKAAGFQVSHGAGLPGNPRIVTRLLLASSVRVLSALHFPALKSALQFSRFGRR
ncbi:MAG: hypothetical protein M3Q86_13595, partial [Verrucomicrobiota bacterium]|nr:hypothetical protein [Verrucomicrobiota bacterium]